MPFGISVVGGSVLKYCAAATLGALIGYILPTGEILTFRYMAAALGVTAIKLLISGVSKENKKQNGKADDQKNANKNNI